MKKSLIDSFAVPVLFLTIVGMVVGVVVMAFVWTKGGTETPACERLRKYTHMEFLHDPWLGCLAKLPDGSYAPFSQIVFVKETK